jgi:uncharacterized protein
MNVEHHPLTQDFPQLRERLHALKLSDTHFARLAEEYEALDKRIVRAEDGIEPVADDMLETLKKLRLALKDEIYARLKT